MEEFRASYRGKAMSSWYNNQNRRMHQPQRKAYKKKDKNKQKENC